MNRSEIGAELRKYRISSCYTQQALGEALGYARPSAALLIRKMELGIIPVPLKHIRKLHDLTGIPYEKLIP